MPRPKTRIFRNNLRLTININLSCQKKSGKKQ
jgi:hypothetical protein